MKKRLASQNVPVSGTGNPAESPVAAQASCPRHVAGAKRSRDRGREARATSPAASGGAEGRTIKNEVSDLSPDLQSLIRKMLVEGSTFENIVEAVDERGGDGITLNAIQNYFQGDLEIQKLRVRYAVESADALLSSVDKDPRSAEARLARATFLTGYARVHRDTASVTLRDAERSRIECENLTLKRQILIMRRKKATQDLDYSRARTRLILLTQGKLQEEILKLQREVKAHRAGDPIGPEMLQRIQQLYGLACQPLLYEESANVPATA